MNERIPLNNFLERIKKFLHRNTADQTSFPSTFFPPISVIPLKPLEPKTVSVLHDSRTEKRQSFHPYLNVEKVLRTDKVREMNVQRQKNTLGYGLKSKNFKPRPGFEKQLWKLDKKPGED